MNSRYANKPDPTIKKNVLQARSSARKAKAAHASMVATSMVATLLAWAAFTGQDAQMAQVTQADSSNQASVVIAAATEVPTEAATQVATATTVVAAEATTVSATSTPVDAAEVTTVSATATPVVEAQAPAALTSTRSSR